MKHTIAAIILFAAIPAGAAERLHVATPWQPHPVSRINAAIPVDHSHPVNCRTVTYTRPAGATGPNSEAVTFHPTVCDRGE